MPADDLSPYFSNVARGEDGIWRTTSSTSISYPAEGHDSCHSVEAQSFWFAHRNRCIASVIGQDPPDPQLPFADIGGGNGYVARQVADLGYRVVLVEPGAAGIAHARDRGLADLVQASIIDLDVVPGSLGAIGLFDVLEHIEDDAGALASLRDMLADGGKIYLTVPAYRWLWSSVDVEAGHFRRYTRGQLRALFARCGFDVGVCSYYFRPLPPPMFLLRSLPELLHLRSGAGDRSTRVNTEHRQSSRLLQRLLAPEVEALAAGREMWFGASCILAATRRPDRSRRA